MTLVERSQTGTIPPPDSARSREAVAAGTYAAGLGGLTLRRSSLTRRIVAFNLAALATLVIGILYLDDPNERLLHQHEQSLRDRALLAADLVAARLTSASPRRRTAGTSGQAEQVLRRLTVGEATDAYFFGPDGQLRARRLGDPPRQEASVAIPSPLLTGLLAEATRAVGAAFAPPHDAVPTPASAAELRALAEVALAQRARGAVFAAGPGPVLHAAARVMQGETSVGALVIADRSGQSARIAGDARERLLQIILIATLVSVALSLALASTIATPLADLAAAAETGRERGRRAGSDLPIPDMTARPDEIGRLSGALRGMVGALTSRIENNEQFAADVAHEIKNPLASLHSAVGTLRIAATETQRARLIEVIEHDVQRLDRLVSDISNASRLDADLVKETEAGVDLVALLRGLTGHLREEAGRNGVDLITDLPAQAIRVTGLESRLAQVFVNLVTNAISFCEPGDAIRVWARRRANRVLVVVEDTGPGIPDEALDKIFRRFYSQRPKGEFGNNSGLGLAISRQIVEAHDGVIWAENIRPTQADPTSAPMGARFVVGLPV